MSISVLDMSVSLDGYIADPDDFLGGDDGERLHTWAEADGEPVHEVPQRLDREPAGDVVGVDDHRRHDVHVRGRRLECQERGIETRQSLHAPSVGVTLGALKGPSGRMEA